MLAEDISSLRDALYKVIEPQSYIELPDCCIALAAIAVIAAMKDKDYSLLPDSAKRWAINMNSSINARLIGLAQKAVLTIATESELQNLWSKSDTYNDWTKLIGKLTERLNSIDL